MAMGDGWVGVGGWWRKMEMVCCSINRKSNFPEEEKNLKTLCQLSAFLVSARVPHRVVCRRRLRLHVVMFFLHPIIFVFYQSKTSLA